MIGATVDEVKKMNMYEYYINLEEIKLQSIKNINNG